MINSDTSPKSSETDSNAGLNDNDGMAVLVTSVEK
jgi:hypothetical protein